MDIWIIGSDISQKAIETTSLNIDYAKFDDMYLNEVIQAKERPIINEPLVLQNHWPQKTNLDQKKLAGKS